MVPISAREGGTLAARLFDAGVATAEVMTIHLGLRLGLYAALRDRPSTAAEVAERAMIGERYAIEWLHQQAAAGFIEAVDGATPQTRLFRLPDASAAALLDPDDPGYIGSMAIMPVGGIAPALPAIEAAMRADAGVAYADYGPDLRAAQADLNRPVFDHHLPRWIAEVLPQIHARLLTGGRVADVACGAGASTAALARSFPAAQVVGFDTDGQAVEEARRRLAGTDWTSPPAVVVGPITPDAGPFDLVCILDALHDMAAPVEVLAACRSTLAPDGALLLMEPRAGVRFTSPADTVERFLYAVSVLHCLPLSSGTPGSARTGTVLRPRQVREHALQAGFHTVDVTGVQHPFHRVYVLRQGKSGKK